MMEDLLNKLENHLVEVRKQEGVPYKDDYGEGILAGRIEALEEVIYWIKEESKL